jgi:hypothetical protein
MSIKDQSDKELADAGRMLMAQINPIAAELERRGVEVCLRGYYPTRHGGGTEYRFEAERITKETI